MAATIESLTAEVNQLKLALAARGQVPGGGGQMGGMGNGSQTGGVGGPNYQSGAQFTPYNPLGNGATMILSGDLSDLGLKESGYMEHMKSMNWANWGASIGAMGANIMGQCFNYDVQQQYYNSMERVEKVRLGNELQLAQINKEAFYRQADSIDHQSDNQVAIATNLAQIEHNTTVEVAKQFYKAQNIDGQFRYSAGAPTISSSPASIEAFLR